MTAHAPTLAVVVDLPDRLVVSFDRGRNDAAAVWLARLLTGAPAVVRRAPAEDSDNERIAP